MKTPAEIIPKFIVFLEKDNERGEYLKNEVLPKISNYIKIKAFDGEKDDPIPFLDENNIIVAEHFVEKCNTGQLGCFISHFNVWKYIVQNNLDLAIVLEDDVKIYKNFNRVVSTVYDNLPVKFDYVHLFIHPDKQKIEYLDGNDGDIIPAEDNFGTVAYMISYRGAKKMMKLTQLLKIQAPVDRQINFYIQHHFLKAYMIKKPFLITQGEIMPNRAIYNNSFRSNIWYSKKLIDANIIPLKYIKPAGFSDEEILALDKELEKNKKLPQQVQQTQENLEENNDNVVETKNIPEPTEEVIVRKDAVEIIAPKGEDIENVQIELKQEDSKNEEDKIVSSIIEKLASID